MAIETPADLDKSFFHSADFAEPGRWSLKAGGGPVPVTLNVTRALRDIDTGDPPIKLRQVLASVQLAELPAGYGEGDTVEVGAEAAEVEAGTSQAGGTATTIVLPASSSAVTGFHVGHAIEAARKTAAIITAYDGPTRTATVDRPWPAGLSDLARYRIYQRAIETYLVAEVPEIDETDRVVTVRLRDTP